jgi:hypothetical protein
VVATLLAHFEQAFVGHGHMALAQVVQQVLHALGNAFALGLDGLFLRLGIHRQEVAGRCRSQPLFDREPDAVLGLAIGLHGLGQTHQRAGVEQIGGRRKRRNRVFRPGITGKSPVFRHHRARQALVPQLGHFLQVGLLDFLQLLGRNAHLRHVHLRRRQTADIHLLKGLEDLTPGVAKLLAKRRGCLFPDIFGLEIHAVSLGTVQPWCKP